MLNSGFRERVLLPLTLLVTSMDSQGAVSRQERFPLSQSHSSAKSETKCLLSQPYSLSNVRNKVSSLPAPFPQQSPKESVFSPSPIPSAMSETKCLLSQPHSLSKVRNKVSSLPASFPQQSPKQSSVPAPFPQQSPKQSVFSPSLIPSAKSETIFCPSPIPSAKSETKCLLSQPHSLSKVRNKVSTAGRTSSGR